MHRAPLYYGRPPAPRCFFYLIIQSSCLFFRRAPVLWAISVLIAPDRSTEMAYRPTRGSLSMSNVHSSNHAKCASLWHPGAVVPSGQRSKEALRRRSNRRTGGRHCLQDIRYMCLTPCFGQSFWLAEACGGAWVAQTLLRVLPCLQGWEPCTPTPRVLELGRTAVQAAASGLAHKRPAAALHLP